MKIYDKMEERILNFEIDFLKFLRNNFLQYNYER